MTRFKVCQFYLNVFAALGCAALLGCVTARAHNTESLLSAAGFRTVTPSTPQQRACFEALPPYAIQRQENDGKVVYAFADKRKGIMYVGDEKQYQQFHRLGVQERIASQQLQAAQMNQDAAMNWSWGPGPVWMWW